MFFFGQHEILTAGVINITPDSFSNTESHLNSSLVEKLFLQFESADVIDIGAQSTAPMNQALDSVEEMKRLKTYFLPEAKKIRPTQILSFDTYHPSTIKWVMGLNLPQKIIWNDVSGIFDKEVQEILENFPHLDYVLNCCAVKDRNETHRHMNFITESPIENQVMDFFSFYQKNIPPSLLKRVTFDPGFGFSKTLEQNIELLNLIPKIMNQLRHPHWWWGISRKSFLKNPRGLDSKNKKDQEKLDQIQTLIFFDWLVKLTSSCRITLRVHQLEQLQGLMLYRGKS